MSTHDIEDIWRSLSENTRLLVAHNAGAHANAILSSADQACDLINHDDARIRLCSLEACHRIWSLGSDPLFVQKCIGLIESESDRDVRFSAVIIINELLSGSKNRAAQRALAELVTDPTCSNDLRCFAFYALRRLEFGDAVPMNDHLNSELEAIVHKIPPSLNTIDWKFVKDFR